MESSDIMNFLNKKFDEKTSKKKKKPSTKDAAKQGQSQSKIQQSFNIFKEESSKQLQLSHKLLYEELTIEDKQMINKSNPSFKSKGTGQGIVQEELKEKIFYIGQNDQSLKKGENVMVSENQPSVKQIAEHNLASQKFKKPKNRLSQNTLKKLEKLQEQQEVNKLFYKDFLVMNQLWQEYVIDLLGKGDNQTSICSKILKAEFCGALIEVVNSKNQTMIGHKGIVFKETARTFLIVTEKVDELRGGNQAKCLLKAGSVFQVKLPKRCNREGADSQMVVNIWGDNILYKGSERTKIKFKERSQLDLY